MDAAAEEPGNSWQEVSVLNVLPPRSESITDNGFLAFGYGPWAFAG